MPSDHGSRTAGKKGQGRRLDKYLASAGGISRTRAQELISEELVLVDGKPAAKSHRLAAGETVSWEIPPVVHESVGGEQIPIEVVYADDAVIVVDKPPDMVMYPGPGHSEHTLLNAILGSYPEVAGVGGEGRSGIFHRLDRDTSGLVAVARTQEAFSVMVDRMQRREVERTYTALVTGSVTAEKGTIDAPIGRSRGNRKKMAVSLSSGRRAVTHFRVTERLEGYTLLDVSLETGRTHQIRVHFNHIGHPVAGDMTYSRGGSARRLGLTRQFLHARRLEFRHPITGGPMGFESPLPKDLSTVLDSLREGQRE